MFLFLVRMQFAFRHISIDKKKNEMRRSYLLEGAWNREGKFSNAKYSEMRHLSRIELLTGREKKSNNNKWIKEMEKEKRKT